MIVPMKKAQIVVLKEDKDSLLKSLQKNHVLMLISSENHQESDTSLEETYIQRTEKSLQVMKEYREKKKMFDYTVVDYDKFNHIDPKLHDLLDTIEGIDSEINRLITENNSIQESINNLLPWKDLDMKPTEISTSKYSSLHTGYIDHKLVDNLTKVINEYGGELNILGRTLDSQALLFACYIDELKEVMEKIKNIGFLEFKLPDEDFLVSEMILNRQNEIAKNLGKISELKEKLKLFSTEVSSLELFNDQMETMTELKRVSRQETLETVFLEGWVRSDKIDQLKTSINDATDIYDLEINDPLPDEMPPTVTKNNKFVSAFETITNMFASPSPNDIDPNPIMAPWYLIIFGMMMADVGYGIVMAILFYVVIKIMKPKGNSLKLIKVLLFASVTTIIWGILFGSYFSVTWNPILMEPKADPTKMLLLSLVIGGLHIITGILAKAYANIKDGKFLAAVVDQFSWIMILVGIGLVFLPAYSRYGTALAITGGVLILLFGGRKSKNVFGKVTGGLGSLYGITGYVSDILSYSRILALSLSTAIIGMVMNMIAGMVQGTIYGFVFSILIYIVGHVFNIGMGLLSAYVHDSRLQYIEFFNKFYEGGGYDFKPLSIKLKYIDEIN